jgi:VCBS repeat protein
MRLSLGFVAVAAVLAAACSATKDNDTGSGGSGNGPGNGGGGQGGGIGGGFTGGFGGGSGGNPPICKVPPDTDDAVVPTCDDKAPADSFDPQEQWSWTAPNSNPNSLYTGSFQTPLVGNFTDDNADGSVDLCDIPEVLVVAIDSFDFGGVTIQSNGTVYALSGDTGEQKFAFQGQVDALVTPAFGDIDGDGLPELVSADPQGRITAWENDGTLKWTGATAGYRQTFASAECPTVAIYDLEGDGNPEILLAWEVFDHLGNRLWGVPNNAAEFDGQYWCVTPTAADLDGDGKLEVLFGHQTYHSDGTLYWQTNQPPSHPHVADLDGDGLPEVFLTNTNGISVHEHDGTLKFGPVRPTDPNPAPNCWGKPAVVHDFDGDGIADIAAATCSDYTVYTVGANTVTPRWTNNVSDFSGLATATAFDFLGDGSSEAIYADETQIYVFDGVTGQTQLTAPRQSGTLIEYPTVADVDNDGSAEIVYVSNYASGIPGGPTITVLRDAMDRWIPARRIWNQYSYHVTNVREDGTIPKVMKKNWLNLNTFRTNSQIGETGDCIPEPPQ